MADYRSLDIKVSHARNLKKVNFLSDMDPYVVVSISTDPQNPCRTPTHKTGNKNPTWNFSLTFPVDVAASRLAPPVLRFAILCERTLGNKPIGDVLVPLVDLLGSVDEKKAYHVAYQVRRPSGRAKGELSFSYQWGERLAEHPPPPTAPPLPVEGKVDDVVTAYPLVAGTSSEDYAPKPVQGYEPYSTYHPAPHGGHEYQYPPVVGYASHPQPSYAGYPPSHEYGGYPPPPHHYGGHPSPGSGYGYAPVGPPPKKKNNKTGMGLAAGLLGGLLVGDLLF